MKIETFIYYYNNKLLLLLGEVGSKWSHAEDHIFNLLFHLVRSGRKLTKTQWLKMLIMIGRFFIIVHCIWEVDESIKYNKMTWEAHSLILKTTGLDSSSIIKYGYGVYRQEGYMLSPHPCRHILSIIQENTN